MSVTLLIDQWQYFVCCIGSAATKCSILMVLYLDRMCQCELLWWHIGSLMSFLAAEPRSTAGPLFPSQCLSGTILLTLFSIVWDWRVSRARTMLFYWPKLLYPYYLSTIFLFFQSIGWHCGAGDFRLTGCISVSLSLALPAFLHNNNNNIQYALLLARIIILTRFIN